MEKFENKGTGAGGANTNRNGLSYENITSLEEHMVIVKEDKKYKTKTVKFHQSEKEFVNANKKSFQKFMESINEYIEIFKPVSGCKQPDEVYIDEAGKKIFIIEKKFQQGSGSVDEKIQTGQFKLYYFSKNIPNYRIYYIYCLSDWFKKEEYKCVLEYLTDNGVYIFWGSDENYKTAMIDFMCNS
jgi:hypothetical protein